MTSKTRLLELLPRVADLFKLVISLSAGAILLIATFLHKPPPVSGAKWLVLPSVSAFLVAFLAFLFGLFHLVKVEGKLTILAVNQELQKPPDADTLKREEEASDLTKKIDKLVNIGLCSFLAGILLMFILAVAVILSWPHTPSALTNPATLP